MAIDQLRELDPEHPQSEHLRELLEADWQDKLKVRIQVRHARNLLSFGGNWAHSAGW